MILLNIFNRISFMFLKLIKISPIHTAKFCLVIFLSISLISCQQSEKPAYKPAAIDQNPISAFLSPEESMKTMHLPEGYHLQLVASEPIIEEPVAIVWDGNGRMFVAEMRSYMKDI